MKVPLTSAQFDALTSFTFNLGAGALAESTLLKKLNARDYAGAQKEFGRWVHAGGEVLAGLVRRRAAEAKLFGSTGPRGATPAPTPTPSPTKAIDYRVRAGDTFSGIAAGRGLSLAQLKALNPQVRDINKINVGQLLHVQAKKKPAPAPKTATYTVRAGDTFSGIATSHHLTLAQLAKLNPQVKNLNQISVGQKLHLKAAAPAPHPAPEPAPHPAPTPGPVPAHGGIPNTSGLSTSKRFAVYEKYIGQDPRKVPMKVFPAVHYSMGGLWIDSDQQTNIPGLFAVGECDFGFHGANRLGANSLLSCLYSGLVAGPAMINEAGKDGARAVGPK